MNFCFVYVDSVTPYFLHIKIRGKHLELAPSKKAQFEQNSMMRLFECKDPENLLEKVKNFIKSVHLSRFCIFEGPKFFQLRISGVKNISRFWRYDFISSNKAEIF